MSKNPSAAHIIGHSDTLRQRAYKVATEKIDQIIKDAALTTLEAELILTKMAQNYVNQAKTNHTICHINNNPQSEKNPTTPEK